MKPAARLIRSPLAWASCLLLWAGPSETFAESEGWRAMLSLPQGNAGFAAGWVGDRLVVAGGTNWVNGEKRWLDEIAVFDRDRAQWLSVTQLQSPLAYAASGTDGSNLYIFGGSDGSNVLDTLWRVGPELVPQRIAETGRQTVYAGAAIGDGSLYVVAGGAAIADLSTLTDAFFRIDLASGRVDDLPSYPGGSIMLPAVVARAGELFVFGGASYDLASRQVVNTPAAFAYSMAARRWRRLAPCPAARRGMAACNLGQGRLMIAGGYGPTDREAFAAEAWIYRIEDDRYERAPALPYEAMSVGLFRDGSMVYVLGGEDQHKHRSSDFYQHRSQDE